MLKKQNGPDNYSAVKTIVCITGYDDDLTVVVFDEDDVPDQMGQNFTVMAKYNFYLHLLITYKLKWLQRMDENRISPQVLQGAGELMFNKFYKQMDLPADAAGADDFYHHMSKRLPVSHVTDINSRRSYLSYSHWRFGLLKTSQSQQKQ